MNPGLEIAPTQAWQWPETLDLLYAALPARERRERIAESLREAAAGTLDLSAMLVARQEGRVIGCCLAIPAPGRGAMLWPPQVRAHATAGPEQVEAALLEAMVETLGRRGVRIAQVLLDPREPETAGAAQLLTRHGFPKLTELYYLRRTLQSSLDLGPAPELEFEPCPTRGQDRIGQIIEETYAGSLDCPELNGVRAIDDVLASYRAVGQFAPERWLVALEPAGRRPVGCLIMAAYPDWNAWEIIYMGVVPAARGQGYGRALARQALLRANQAGAALVMLAVDARNAPARRVYAQLQFAAWQRRSVYLRIFG